jgi:hypothetical protein
MSLDVNETWIYSNLAITQNDINTGNVTNQATKRLSFRREILLQVHQVQ